MKKYLIYLAVISLSLTGLYLCFLSQRAPKTTRIGVLQWTEEVAPFRQTREGVLAGLKALGLKEGENLTLTMRNAEQDPHTAQEAIREFSQSKVDLVITIGTHGTLTALEAAPELPVVFTLVAAPKETGIITGVPDSGRHLTGITMLIPALTQLQTVQKVLPGLTRMGVLYCTKTLPAVATGNEAAAAARSLGWQVTTLSLDAKAVSTLDGQVAELAAGVDAIYIPADSVLYLPATIHRIGAIAEAHGVPLICVDGEFVRDAVALMAVHCNFTETGKQVKNPVEKILGGVSPGEIPPQNPQRHELSINLATARRLKVAIHRNTILMADNIYE